MKRTHASHPSRADANRTAVLFVRLTPEQHKEIARMAKAEDRSMSSVARRLIQRSLGTTDAGQLDEIEGAVAALRAAAKDAK